MSNMEYMSLEHDILELTVQYATIKNINICLKYKYCQVKTIS